MVRYIAYGTLLFVLFAVVYAPASLLDRIVASPQVDLLEPRGTLWHGQAKLLVSPHDLGQVDWQFQPTSLIRAMPTYDLQLSHQHWQLNGNAGVGFTNAQVLLAGAVNAQAINQWLSIYDIQLGGDFDISPTQASIDHTSVSVTALDGQLNWSGGFLRYTLSGILREAHLPPLTAMLSLNEDQQPQAIVYAEGEQIPLLIASLTADGFAKVAITKLFTKMLDNPYPGSDPDHAVVIQVEEKII